MSLSLFYFGYFVMLLCHSQFYLILAPVPVRTFSLERETHLGHDERASGIILRRILTMDFVLNYIHITCDHIHSPSRLLYSSASFFFSSFSLDLTKTEQA